MTRPAASRRPDPEAFRLFFEGAPGAFLVLDPLLRIVGATDRYLELTMTRREEILDRFVFDVFPDNPEDPGATGVRNLRASLERVVESGRADTMGVQRYDVRRRPEAGGAFEERWWKPLNVPIHDSAGSLVGIIHSVEDVTEARRLDLEREAEARARALEAERFHAISRATREAVWDWRMDEGRIAWNENLSLTYGVSEASLATIEAWFARIHPDDRARVNASLEAAFEGGDDLWSGEYRFLRGDRSVAHVFDRGLVIRDAAGRPVRMIGSMQDITERVEWAAELERLRSESAEALRDHRRVLEHSLDLFVSIAEDGRCLQVSEAARTILGREPFELIGRDLLEFVHPDDVEASAHIRAEVRAGVPVSTFRNRMVRSDGSLVPLMWSSVWIPDERMTYAVGRDVTELVAAEQEIRRLGQHLETTLESISQACCTFDRDWRFLYVNRQFEEFVGRSRDELLGKVIWEEYPDGMGLFLREDCRRALEDRASVAFEAHLPERGAWYEVTAHPTPDGAALLFRDITVRKSGAERIEEQAAAIEQAQDAIIIRDLDQRIRSWNAGAARLYGYTAEEAMGRRIDDLLHLDHELFRDANDRVLRDGGWGGELRLRRADGSDVVVDARWSLLRREDGSPRAILTINTDLTEKKRFEEQFLRAQRMESLGRLAGGIAHDLNNVLTPILMASGFLREAVQGDAEASETLDTVVESANRGAEMVQQVLAFARGIEGRRVPVALDGVLDQLRRMIEETFPPDIDFHVKYDPETWSVVGDPTQLHQLFLNLCVNARDALGPGGGGISIRTRNVTLETEDALASPDARAGRFVLVEVADTGTGIPAAVLDKIFEPFFTTKELGSGTGLGLSTVQAIVSSHQGWIAVASQLQRGTTFRIHLPADPEAEVPADDDDGGQPFRGRGELVLVVDDEEAILDVSRRSLEGAGYRVLTAGDGLEALERYGDCGGEIDLVLTDVMMPFLDGPTLIRRLRRLDPRIGILATSGIEPPAGLDEQGPSGDTPEGATAPSGAAAAGPRAAAGEPVRFLAKPFTPESMLRAVRSALDARDGVG